MLPAPSVTAPLVKAIAWYDRLSSPSTKGTGPQRRARSTSDFLAPSAGVLGTPKQQRVSHPDTPCLSRIARQVKHQRDRYACSVLGSLARSQQARPTAQIQHLLCNSLTPIGVRLSSAKLQQLAADIAVGGPVAVS